MTPSIVARCGELYPPRVVVGPHPRRSQWQHHAGGAPAVAMITTSPTTRGELANAQVGTFVLVSEAALRDQTTEPLRASSAFTIPVAPNVYTRPLLSVGVPRGPGPAFDSQKRAASLCRQTGCPVVRL